MSNESETPHIGPFHPSLEEGYKDLAEDEERNEMLRAMFPQRRGYWTIALRVAYEWGFNKRAYDRDGILEEADQRWSVETERKRHA